MKFNLVLYFKQWNEMILIYYQNLCLPNKIGMNLNKQLFIKIKNLVKTVLYNNMINHLAKPFQKILISIPRSMSQ